MALYYPYSDQAERSALGAMILEEEAMIIGVSTLYDEDFYVASNRKIFNAIKNLQQRKVAIDATTLANELTDMKCLEEVGGIPTLVELTDNVTSSNMNYYVDVLKEKTNLRRLAEYFKTTVDEFDSKTLGDVNDYLNEIEKDVLTITRERRVGGFKKTSDIIATISQKISSGTRNTLSGIDTGYPDLNAIIQGWNPGDLVILAARPGVGKSALALNFAAQAADKADKAVAFFSLEMPAEHMVQRMLAFTGMIEQNKLKTLNIVGKDVLKFQQATSKLSKLRIYIDDTPGSKLLTVQDKARKLKASEPDLGLIIIDYLNLLSIGGKTESRQQEVAEISRGLKSLARELKLPVIALAQLSRNVEQRGVKADKRPGLSDLRESGAIEQDADIVMFIYREDYYKKGEEEVTDDNVATELIIDKHRSGARGTVNMVFSKQYSLFSSTNSYRTKYEGDK